MVPCLPGACGATPSLGAGCPAREWGGRSGNGEERAIAARAWPSVQSPVLTPLRSRLPAPPAEPRPHRSLHNLRFPAAAASSWIFPVGFDIISIFLDAVPTRPFLGSSPRYHGERDESFSLLVRKICPRVVIDRATRCGRSHLKKPQTQDLAARARQGSVGWERVFPWSLLQPPTRSGRFCMQ